MKNNVQMLSCFQNTFDFSEEESDLVISPHEALNIATTNPIRYYGQIVDSIFR